MPDENIIRFGKSIIVRTESFSDVLKEAIEDGFIRLIKPAIEREIRNSLTEKAEDGAISVFGQNLKTASYATTNRRKNSIRMGSCF